VVALGEPCNPVEAVELLDALPERNVDLFRFLVLDEGDFPEVGEVIPGVKISGHLALGSSRTGLSHGAFSPVQKRWVLYRQ
jgi:hypothetical protein